MIENGRDEDARDDGHRRTKPYGENEREKLCLVADFRDRDGTEGNEEGFQGNTPCRAGQPMTPAPLPGRRST